MKFAMHVVIGVVLFASPVFAQREPESVQPDQPVFPMGNPLDRLEVMSPPADGVMMTNHILFVVDVSQSMNSGHAFDQALDLVNALIMANVDHEYHVSVIVFNTRSTRWYPSPTRPWVTMPDERNAIRAHNWIVDQGANGGTHPRHALREALLDDENQLSIVLITDGEFDRRDNSAQVFAQGQQGRMRRGQNGAILYMFIVGGDEENQSGMRALAEHAQGGVYALD